MQSDVLATWAMNIGLKHLRKPKSAHESICPKSKDLSWTIHPPQQRLRKNHHAIGIRPKNLKSSLI